MRNALRLCKLARGGGTDESSIEYLDVREADGYTLNYLTWLGIAVTGNMVSMPDGNLTLACGVPINYYQLTQPEGESPKYIAIDAQWKMIVSGQEMTIGEMLLGILGDKYSKLPRITKEQFYDLTT